MIVKSKTLAKHLNKGPVAIIRDEDEVNLADTIAHAKSLGFPNTLVLGRTPPLEPDALFIETDPAQDTHEIVNEMIDTLAGHWIYLGHNAE